MLPRQHRLTRSRDFVRIRRHGRSAGSRLVALYVLPAHPPQIRVGFSASKRVGKAVVRNRVKRLLREAVRHQLPHLCPGQDMIFIARPASASASFHELADTIDRLLLRTGAVCRDA